MVKHWQSINCCRRRNPNRGLIDLKAPFAIAEDFPSHQEKSKVFYGNVLISGTFDGREGAALLFPSISLHFAFKPRLSHSLHGSLPLPTAAAPTKKVPNGKRWVSL